MKSLLRVLAYLKPYKFLVIATLSFAIFTTLMDLLPPWLIEVIIDQLVDEDTRLVIYWAVAALVGAYVLRNYSNYRRIKLNNELEQQVVFDIRSHVYRSLQTLSLNYFENRSTGEIMSRVGEDVTYVERIFVDGVEQFVTAALTLIGITIILFYMHWKLALAALIPIPLLVIGGLKFTRSAQKQYHIVRERAAKTQRYSPGHHLGYSRNHILQSTAARTGPVQKTMQGFMRGEPGHHAAMGRLLAKHDVSGLAGDRRHRPLRHRPCARG